MITDIIQRPDHFSAQTMADATTPNIDGSFKCYLKPGMNRPHDVICHQGQYIVTDTFYNRVIAVNPADSSSDVLCKKKEGSLASNMRPYGIVALSDSKQDFLFTDAVNRHILRYTDDTCKVWSEAELPQKGRPAGITLDSTGHVYVTDCENRCVLVYDNNGKYCRSFGSDNLQSPWFLKFNSEGHLFVTDSHAGVKIFTKDGQFVKKLTIRTENRSWTCRGIAIDQFDNIFVTARTTKSFRLLSREMVVVFGPDHKVVSSFGGVMHFNFVRGICCDYGRNNLVVVDGEWHRLQLYKLYGQQPQNHHTNSAPTHQSTSVMSVKSSKDDDCEVTRDRDDCESGIDEDFEVLSLSLFSDQDDYVQDDDDDDPLTCVDDYDYDYSHLELFKEENYNIASPNLHSETGE